MKETPPEDGVEIPLDEIDAETLDRMIESFVLREGTDYGDAEASLEKKVNDVKRQLARKEIKIVFDLTTETCSFVSHRR